MQKYIGTKIVKGEPGKAPKDMGTYTEGTDGMIVEYEDGYRSWSPQHIFDGAYRRIDNMTFGLAIEAMKAGKKVARAGWNGKGMWLRVVYPYLDKQFLVIEGDFCEGTLLPYIGMKTADNGFVPWLASQTDMLSDDWMIVE